MSSRQRKTSVTIEMRGNRTHVIGPGLDATFRYKWWLLHVNPRLLPPGFRFSNQRVIYVNGKRYGHAKYRDACPPIPERTVKGKWIGVILLNFIRTQLGWKVEKHHRGYYKLKLGKYTYIVTQHVSKQKFVYCRVFLMPSGEDVGALTFEKDLSKVYTSLGQYNIINTLYVISGYIADSILFSLLGNEFYRTIEVA